ncbi:MAG: fluoride efflux transporter CrcB [Rickettsiales bacterium]|nr:fluoride efflux transporter CrcB [Rickettsiales bacterium]
MNILLIAIGGALGSVTRYLFSDFFLRLVKSGQISAVFPYGTFFVNVFGSLLAGVIYYFVIKNFDAFDPRLKNFLIVGFLGGFTTFSAFSLDFFRLVIAGHHLQAFIYAVSSLVLAICAVFFGFYFMKVIFS